MGTVLFGERQLPAVVSGDAGDHPGVPAMNKLIPLKRPRLRDAVSITVVAQFVSFPLTIYYFSQFSLLSFAANFFCLFRYSV